jgi:hypothetical protein
MRDVVPLESFQQRRLDFRLLGNRLKADVLVFTLLAQSGA